MPQPVLLDTDIGTDIDDAYALLLAAVSPELDLRGVTTVNNDTTLRAQIARRLLQIMNRSDVPVAVGAREAITPGIDRGWMGHEGRGIELSSAGPSAEYDSRDAAKLIADCARQAHVEGTPLTLFPIGAMTNIALAIRDYPDEMALVGRIIAMASSFEGYGLENARGEHNVACDPDAFRMIIESGLPVILIGLNVTRETAMTKTQVEAMAGIGGPLARDLAGMHTIWFEQIGRDHSAMHDGLAVAIAFRPDLVELIPVEAHMLAGSGEQGAVVYNAPSPGKVTNCQIAVSVDAEAFQSLLQERTLAACRNA
jgi:inosine-uridine nucleoside N-ribohydrolase